jgi:hypothetical protein
VISDVISVTLPECVIRSLILRFRTFKDIMKNTICGPKMKEITGDWRELHKVELPK